MYYGIKKNYISFLSDFHLSIIDATEVIKHMLRLLVNTLRKLRKDCQFTLLNADDLMQRTLTIKFMTRAHLIHSMSDYLV